MPPPSVCFRCLRPTLAAQTCSVCFAQTGVSAVWRVCVYVGAGKELIWRLKFTGAQSAAALIAGCFINLYKPAPEALIVPLPTATGRVRQRGYDQAALVARAYANMSNCRYAPCLARSGQQHQRGNNRAIRLKQLDGAYRVRRGINVRGASILLVDDVATTGASLQAAAQTLLAAGAAKVEAIVFAQA